MERGFAGQAGPDFGKGLGKEPKNCSHALRQRWMESWG